MSAALLALALAAAAQDWQRAGTAPGVTGYYDPASVVVIDATTRRVRVRAVYDSVTEQGAASGIALVEVDCVNHTGTLLEVQQLDAAGHVIANIAIPIAERRAERNPPGGPEAFVHARVCGTPSS